jgi:hypothetical protein
MLNFQKLMVRTLTLIYTWHMGCRRYMPYLICPTMATKPVSLNEKKPVSSFCSQEVITCFMLASVANHLPASCHLRGAEIRKSQELILPTRPATGYGGTPGRLRSTFPSLEDEETIIL